MSSHGQHDYYCILKVTLGERVQLSQGSLIHEGDLESYLPRAVFTRRGVNQKEEGWSAMETENKPV